MDDSHPSDSHAASLVELERRHALAEELERDANTPSGYKWSSSRGPDAKINGGTLGQADVVVSSLPLLSLIIPPLRQYFGSSRSQ